MQLEALVGIASTAGLLADNGSVSVFPPRSVTPENRNWGSVFCRSPVDLKPQSVDVSMLWPSDVIEPAQFDAVAPLPTVFDATIEFSTEMLLPVPAIRPPALVVAVPPSLLKIVESTTVTVLVVHRTHRLPIPPAPPAAVLPARVELLTVTVAVVAPLATLAMPPEIPPLPLEAKLRLSSSSECVIVSVPPTFATPAPSPPVVSPRTMSSSLSVSVPSFRTFPPMLPFVEPDVVLPKRISSPEIVTVGATPLAGSGWMSNTRATGVPAGGFCSTVVVRAPAPVIVMFWSISSSPAVSV